MTNRKRPHFLKSMSASAIVLLSLAFVPYAGAETINWTGAAATNSWHNAANWDLNRLPAAGDDVIIPDMTPNVIVTFSAGSTSINSLTSAEAFSLTNGSLTIAAASTLHGALTLIGGILTGAGDVTVHGPITWTFANLFGTGALNANGGIAMSGDTFTRTLSQRTLNNAGIATISGTGSLVLNQGAVWNNLTGSTFEIQNATPIGFTVSPAGTFNNSGTLRKTSAGASNVSIPLNNDGVIQVQTGTLSLSGGGTSGGVFDIAALSNVILSGTHAVNAGMSLSGTGTLTVASGTTTFTDAPVGAGNFALTGGVANFNGVCELNSLALTGGALGGTGNLTVTGPVTWTFANLIGTGVLNANGGIAISGDTFTRTLSQRTLNNAGLATFSGTGSLALNQGAVWNNLPGSTLEIQNTAPIGFTVGPAGTLNNSGTVRKISTGTSNIAIGVSNPGTIEVATGILNITGAFSSFSGSTLASGTYLLAGALRFPGASIVTNNAVIVLDGPTSAIQNTSGVDALTGFASNASTGSFHIKNGRNFNRTGAFNNAGNVRIGPGVSALSAAGGFVQTNGQTMLDGGALEAAPHVEIQGGVLSGNGTILADVTNAGICRVGLSPGSIFISGDYVQSSAGTLEAEIGGLTAGIGGFDQLLVGGTALLAGTLNVALFGGFEPDVGDAFDIVVAASRNGVFDTHTLPLTFSQNCKGEPQYGTTFVRINTHARVLISDQPDSQAVCMGEPVTLSVVANGTGPLSYQWRKSGVDISGATGSSFTDPDVQPADAGGYDVIVTNICGFENSAAAILTVNAAPSFSDHPDSQTVCMGSHVIFTATASGIPTPTYQWRKNGFDIEGETGTTLSLTNVNPADAGEYDCVSTNICGSPVSAPAALTVNTPADVFDDPESVAACQGSSVSFTVAATGTPPPTYQWRKGEIEIAGATGATLDLIDVHPDDAGSYDCVVTNSCGTSASAAATLTVNTDPIFGQRPVAASACAGGIVVFSVSATGSPAPTYQWRRNQIPLENDGNISGADTPILTINPVGLADVGDYDCVIENDCSTSDSADASLTVYVSGSGDTNGDLLVDGADVQAFVAAVLTVGPPSATQCAADMNMDGTLDLLDVAPFVELLAAP